MSSPTLRKRFRSDGSPIKRSRSNSRVKLEELYRLLDVTILDHQVHVATKHPFNTSSTLLSIASCYRASPSLSVQ